MGKPRISSVIIVEFQADIWTQDLSNTKQILPIRTKVRIINADLRVKFKYVTTLRYSATCLVPVDYLTTLSVLQTTQRRAMDWQSWERKCWWPSLSGNLFHRLEGLQRSHAKRHQIRCPRSVITRRWFDVWCVMSTTGIAGAVSPELII